MARGIVTDPLVIVENLNKILQTSME
jgi:hypothetical protein